MRLFVAVAVALTATSFFAFRALAGNKSNPPQRPWGAGEAR
jgi:hypothetical protein